MTVAIEERKTVEATPAEQGAAGGNGVAALQSNTGHKHQHIHAAARRGRQKARTITVTSAVVAVIAVIVVLTVVPRAVQDARLRAAVTDSVQLINTTLSEHVDGFLEGLAKLSDHVNAILPGADEGPRPGQLAAAAGLRAHHPIVIVPGFVTTGLELWEGEPCAQSYFRQRLWGTLSMAQTLLSDRMCWMRHMKLDPVTGSDPPHIKLRAAKALEAVDYFVPGYWVFSKLIQSLSDIGYDNNNLIAVPYDWRLPIPMMEERDGYFTRLKHEVQLQHQLSRGIKPLLVSHSYGATVTLTFMHWVEQQSPGWVETYLAGYVNLAGPLLGLPKALSPMLSGETRETVDMMAGLAVLVEQYLGKQSRAALFRTWGSVMAMLPVGGSKVWGNASFAPDDDDTIRAAGRSYGGIIAEVRSADTALKEAVGRNDSSLLSSDSLRLLHTTLHNWGHTIKHLGSAAVKDDDDGEDDAGQAADGGSNGSAAGSSGAGGAGGAADVPQVRFLDVGSAITALARTGGEQLTVNLKKWSPAGQDLSHQLDQVIAAHRVAAESLAAAQLDAACDAPEGDDSGYCSDGSGNTTDGSDGSSNGSSDGSGINNDGSDGSSNGNDGSSDGSDGSSDGSSSCSGSNGSNGMCDESEEVKYQQLKEGGTDSSTVNSNDASSGSSHDGSSGGSNNGNVRSNDASSSDTQGGKRSGLFGTLKRTFQGSSGSSDSSRGSSHDEVKRPGAVHPANVVRVPLPSAKDFRVYCFYGIGTPTERGYHYLKTRKRGPGGAIHTEWSVNVVADDPKSGLEDGVQLQPDGDGTVPLLSLGALCAGGWRTRRLNPGGVPVVIREYPNHPVPVLRDARGGANASTHVEILGNEPMLNDLLHIAAGQHSSIQDSIHTQIREFAAKIPWDDL